MDDLSLAKKLLEIGDRDGALKELSQILKGNLQNIEALHLCAKATQDINQKKEYYRTILKLDSNNIEAARELKILISPPQVNTQPNAVSERTQYNQQKIDLSAIASKGKDFIRLFLSDKGFKIIVPILIGLILIIFGISFLIKPKEQVPVSPNSTSTQPLMIIVKPPNITITPPPTYTPQPTKTLYPTHTPKPTYTSSPFLWPGPASRYVPLDNMNLLINYSAASADEGPIKEGDTKVGEMYNVLFLYNNSSPQESPKPCYSFHVVVGDTVEEAELVYDAMHEVAQSDNGDIHYQLLNNTFYSTLFDQVYVYAGGSKQSGTWLQFGRGFRIKNVVVVIMLWYLTEDIKSSDIPKLVQDLDTMTTIVLEKFR